MLDHRSKRQDRQIGQGDHNQRCPNDHRRKQQRVRLEFTPRHRPSRLPRKQAREGQCGNCQCKTTEKHSDGRRPIVEGRVGGEPRKALPVVGKGRRVGVEDLGETMWTAIGRESCEARADRHC